MNRYEKILKEMTVEKFIELEKNMVECDNCECYKACNHDKREITCEEYRREWLLEEI